MIRIISLLFFIFSSGVIYSQQIKTITETFTYFETDSAYYSWGKTVHEWEYDKNGNLIKDHDREGVCFIDRTYDKKGQLVKEESHCGEGSSEIEITYEKSLRITKTKSNYFQSIETDSFDNNNRLVYQIQKFNNGTDEWQDTNVISVYKKYKYNEKGSLAQCDEFDNEMQLSVSTRFLYNMQNKPIAELTFSEKGVCKDSTAFVYDNKNRLIKVSKFDFQFRDFPSYKESEITAAYSEILPEQNVTLLNDTILAQLKSYSFFAAPGEISAMPLLLTYTFLPVSDDSFFAVDLDYSYFYDTLGRISHVSGSGTNIGEHQENLKAEISYYENDEAVMNVFGQTYLDNLIVAQSYHYKKGRLEKIIEYSESGFPYTVRKFEYTYFK